VDQPAKKAGVNDTSANAETRTARAGKLASNRAETSAARGGEADYRAETSTLPVGHLAGRVRVRYFAGARAAAGCESEIVEASTVGGLVAALSTRDSQLGRVLAACSFLVDGLAVRDLSQRLPVGCLVDVLPPFAGG
jgi:molybdopterin converting factor small subunit